MKYMLKYNGEDKINKTPKYKCKKCGYKYTC